MPTKVTTKVKTEKTFTNPQEAIAYLEQTLATTLRDSAQGPVPGAIQMCCMDSTTHECHESAGGPERVSETAIAFLKKSGAHHAGVFITVGNHRLSIKISPSSCRVTVTPLASMPVKTAAPKNPVAGAHSLSDEGPPRPPGLSGTGPSGAMIKPSM